MKINEKEDINNSDLDNGNSIIKITEKMISGSLYRCKLQKTSNNEWKTKSITYIDINNKINLDVCEAEDVTKLILKANNHEFNTTETRFIYLDNEEKIIYDEVRVNILKDKFIKTKLIEDVYVYNENKESWISKNNITYEGLVNSKFLSNAIICGRKAEEEIINKKYVI